MAARWRGPGVWRTILGESLVVALAVLLTVTVAAAAYDLAGARTVSAPPLDPHGHRVRTGDVTTYYEKWGRTGPPVVLVHGFLESSAVWSRVGPLLARKGYRVYAFDVRGFGYTDRRGPYTLAGDTAQLAAFLRALGLDAAHHSPATLVGHSSGAAVVGNLARVAPRGVHRVVFLDGDGTPFGVGPAWVHRLFVDPYATALIRLATRHPWLAERVYRGACGPTCPPFAPEVWLRPFRIRDAEPALKEILRRPLIGMTFDQERQIRVPAAVLYGEQDPQMTRAEAEATAGRLHTDVVRAVPASRHLVMLSAPRRLATELAALSR